MPCNTTTNGHTTVRGPEVVTQSYGMYVVFYVWKTTKLNFGHARVFERKIMPYIKIRQKKLVKICYLVGLIRSITIFAILASM